MNVPVLQGSPNSDGSTARSGFPEKAYELGMSI